MAMEVAGVFPETEAWSRFAQKLLLWLGVLSMAVGVVFFVAFNWDAMGKYGKFALLEGLLILSLLPLLRYDRRSLIGQIALIAGSILVGALLALIGQTYQSGADTWQLFGTWALLILPWAILARSTPLWILWIGITNTALVLYFSLFPLPLFGARSSEAVMALAVLLFNALILFIWEWKLRAHPGSNRLALRIPATLAAMAATTLGLQFAIASGSGAEEAMPPFFRLILWALWLGITCLIYRTSIRDLFMLTLGCLSVIIVVVGWLGVYVLPGMSVIGLSLMTVVLVIVGGGTTAWLRLTYHHWREEDA